MIGRRSFLTGGLAGLAASSALPGIAFARVPGHRRFVFVIQRGGADGLHLVPPLGDPRFEALRAPFMSSLEGAHACDGIFSLHPALRQTAGLYTQGQVIIGNAVATGYRERSHFDGQNILETGARHANEDKTGWMNRLIGLLSGEDSNALALAAAIPAVMRGDRPVSSYAPSQFNTGNEELMMEVGSLYTGDFQLGALWDRAMAIRELVGESAAKSDLSPGAETGKFAATLLALDHGARIMTIETHDWDMHAEQLPRSGQKFGELDALLGALARGLGAAWQDTLVLVATEFGRTAAVNGTMGTDHGTASAAFLLGGALRGGRVIGDWPGLAPDALYQRRDLMPTMAMEALVSGALAGHFGLDPELTARALYPALDTLRPVAL